MDEQEEKIEEEEKPQTSRLVDDTNLAAKRLEEATEAAKAERIAAEESYSKMKLGGETNAGQIVEEKEETPKEYAEKVMTGKIEK